jgi:hypothetical protein
MTAIALPFESISAFEEPRRSRRVRHQTSQSAAEVTPIDRPELAAAFRRLWSLKNLKENWNSYGAAAVDDAALRSAHTLLGVAGNLRTLPVAIIPTARGGVQLEWKLPDRELEVEVLPDQTVQVLLVEGEQESEQEGISVERLTTEVLFRLLHG